MSTSPAAAVAPFQSSEEHMLAELARIDILIRAEVARARQFQQTDGMEGLFISEEEIDALLSRPVGLPAWATRYDQEGYDKLKAQCAAAAMRITERVNRTAQSDARLRLRDLANTFHLSRFDLDVLLLCLGMELDSRYERLYGYLHDDVTRKRPSVDLALNLLCLDVEEKLQARQRFLAKAPLLRYQLISVLDESPTIRSSLPSRYLQLDERVASYILGNDDPDSRLIDSIDIRDPDVALESFTLSRHAENRLRDIGEKTSDLPAFTLYLQGVDERGKQSAAEFLCVRRKTGLVIVDIEQLLADHPDDFRNIVRLVLREAMLHQRALYCKGFPALLTDEQKSARRFLFHEVLSFPELVVLSGEDAWEPPESGERPYFRLEIPFPEYADRLRLWSDAFGPGVETDGWLPFVAGRYRLTGQQIHDAAKTARSLSLLRQAPGLPLDISDVQEACRLHSNRSLGALARKIKAAYRWEDIVLPVDSMRHLREVCNTCKYRSIVYEQWGFDHKLSLGKGINVLFAGPSGTGKTMAAEILAEELGLDLYKIDLSTIVSKYIGETEKNLSRIFVEAASSNAILFFDEADALFGKRSEVRDSHDRYANIEVNYLLQEMEQYEGIAILATNLRRNMDEAFVRRLQFVLEFPLPRAADRLRIWSTVWPADTPRDPDLDLEFLADSFELTGGNIRNIVLNAAFLAASTGGPVTMTHLLRATRREYGKMGKMLSEDEFGCYSDLDEIWR